MRLSQLGELGLLAELERRGLIVGVEHDAAELAGGLVEGVHFRLDRMSWRDLGWRAAAVNLGDLSASGADPEALLVSLAVPAETELDDVLELYAGLAETGVPVAGGDTTSAAEVVVSVTAVGRSTRVPGRAGARPGDVLVVTGELGAAGAAFRDDGGYVRPPLRLAEGKALAAAVHAMLDVSDGIAVDAGHLARRSGVRVVVDLDRVPLAPGATVADLGFGEDFELLAACKEQVAHVYTWAVEIGRVEPGEGVDLRLHGEPHALPGWEHFARR
jgi:thiamine-monophosphate kinase